MDKDGTVGKLNVAGAKLRIPITVRTQPAQSPDFNICDLALLRALKCAVRKVVVSELICCGLQVPYW